MKGYILDSDTWIEYFRHRGGVDKHIAETPAEQIYASEVSIAELTYGALHSKAVEKHLKEPKEIEEAFTVLPLGDWMRDYAEIRQALTCQGIIVGDFDILIAVTARHYGLTELHRGSGTMCNYTTVLTHVVAAPSCYKQLR